MSILETMINEVTENGCDVVDQSFWFWVAAENLDAGDMRDKAMAIQADVRALGNDDQRSLQKMVRDKILAELECFADTLPICELGVPGVFDGWKATNFFKIVAKMLQVRAQTEMSMAVVDDVIGQEVSNKRGPTDRPIDLAEPECPIRRERLDRGQWFLTHAMAQGRRPELRGHQVEDTIADGMCFLNAVVLQLNLDKRYTVWGVAGAFLQWMSSRIPEWAPYVDDEYREERVENLRAHGVMREVERRNILPDLYNAYLYLLDRCAGIVDRDWGSPRLYCDGLFLEEFAKWLSTRILIIRCNNMGRVDYVGPENENTDNVFVFKVVHYSDQPEHFNAICGPEPQAIEEVRQQLKHNILKSRQVQWWKANTFDVLVVAIEVLPAMVDENISSEEGASDEEEEEETGAEGRESVPKRQTDEADVTAGKLWIPRAMPLENSPHPRAVQELRFVALSAEWHKWVTVPEFVSGVPTTREILDDAIALPPKHCMWKNCQWSGATNKERWSHIRASHWTTALAEAVAYYSADNGEDCNLETVLGQVAGILTRKKQHRSFARQSIGDV